MTLKALGNQAVHGSGGGYMSLGELSFNSDVDDSMEFRSLGAALRFLMVPTHLVQTLRSGVASHRSGSGATSGSYRIRPVATGAKHTR